MLLANAIINLLTVFTARYGPRQPAPVPMWKQSQPCDTQTNRRIAHFFSLLKIYAWTSASWPAPLVQTWSVRRAVVELAYFAWEFQAFDPLFW
jgi:hypothetical protein